MNVGYEQLFITIAELKIPFFLMFHRLKKRSACFQADLRIVDLKLSKERILLRWFLPFLAAAEFSL